MPTWSGILEELRASASEGQPPDADGIRRKYLTSLYEYTGREVILYATKWTQPAPNVSPELVSIVDEDLQAMMEVIHGLSGPDLDLILHSPGGSAEAAEAIVLYLRSKFEHIRVIVPQMAMSAATMIACAADVVLMDKHSFVSPIDPQIIVNTPLGQRAAPAEAILDQFDRAMRECQDPAKLGAWLPMLAQYGPDLLLQCEHARDMSRDLVHSWLKAYMFKNEARKDEKAATIADWLSDHERHKSHRRHIPRTQLEANGMEVEHLEDDQQLQDLVLSVFHATTHTFDGTRAVKIVENHLGKAFIKQVQVQQVRVPIPRPQDEEDSPPTALGEDT